MPKTLWETAKDMARFLEAFRTTQGLDAEPEVAEPAMCVHCGVLPAAYNHACFGCNAKRERLSA